MDLSCTCLEVMRSSGGDPPPRIHKPNAGWRGVISLTPRLFVVELKAGLAQSWSGRLGEENNLLSLLGIEQHFLI